MKRRKIEETGKFNSARSEQKRESLPLHGLQILISTSYPLKKRRNMEKKIVQYGGIVVRNKDDDD
jgi:hypothetical protein